MQQSSPVAAGEPRHHSVPTSLAAAQDASRPSPLREVSEQPAGLQSTDTEPQLQQLVHQPAQNQTGLVSQAQQQQQQQPSAAPQEYKAVSSRHDRPSPEAQEKDIAQLDAMEPHHASLDARRSADGDNVAPGAQEQTALSEVTTLPASQHAAEQQEEEDSQEAVVDHPHAQDTVSAATNGKQESSPEDDAEDTAKTPCRYRLRLHVRNLIPHLLQEEVHSYHVEGRHPKDGPRPPPWQARLQAHQAERLQAGGVLAAQGKAGRPRLLPELLPCRSLEGQHLEAQLANGADRHHEHGTAVCFIPVLVKGCLQSAS